MELATMVVEPGGVTAAAIAATIREDPIPALDVMLQEQGSVECRRS
ncbi:MULTISPECIES: hypothetical protein [unclassified Streptomyces]|nr:MULTISPECIES: hypothetical protein [unclassified Streptomyces]WSF81749.1 hypothetical protein OIE70_00135 [Streptomyces sp. NBC_01744]WSC34116.1 hypothetical protein OHA08_00125 [Streptomyces sp. NBC_01763]WSC41942.1 hypothetical protein OHA08_44855 [Streptomyces sp. NBC_01763]WSC50914.1 hypothetical protein OG808_00125 [Streptomyces sp. NBC_01761]WSC58607.1 hypothetical protein OG808_44190 [Streptomyces sp. NBC_01761]